MRVEGPGTGRPRTQRRPTPADVPAADEPDTLLRGRAQGRGAPRLPVRRWPASWPVPPGVRQPAGRGCGHQRCDHRGWPGAPGSWPLGQGGGPQCRLWGLLGRAGSSCPFSHCCCVCLAGSPPSGSPELRGPDWDTPLRGCWPASLALLGTPGIATLPGTVKLPLSKVAAGWP